MQIKVISKNRKAFHDYEVMDKYEAGIALVGTEVKALRAAKVNLSDGWVDIDAYGDAQLKDVHIGHYEFGNRFNHNEKRPRQLLLNKTELAKLTRAISERGLSIVPLQVYFKGRHIKVEIALARGKKAHDKREATKSKDARREIDRAMKR